MSRWPAPRRRQVFDPDRRGREKRARAAALEELRRVLAVPLEPERRQVKA